MENKKQNLTTTDYWSNAWSGFPLPQEINTNVRTFSLINKLLQDKLPQGDDKKFLEIGCAPGSWMAYFNREFKYKVFGIENSKDSFEIAKKNLEILKVDGEVINGDAMNNSLERESFDVVFSHGFIEHFADLDKAILAHLNLLKKGGFLVIDVPNLRYFNYYFQLWLNREALEGHNLKTMSLDYFQKDVIEKYNLEPIYLGYLGSFYSFLFAFKGNDEPRIWKLFRRIAGKIFTWLPYFESRFFSAYIFLVARKK